MKRASITVEAAYIVPVILIITIVFLCVIMMGHDRGVIYLELRRYSEELCSSPPADTDDVKVDVGSLQKRMLIYHIDYINVECKSNKVIIKGQMTCNTGPEQLRDCSISFKQGKVNACKNVRRIVLSNG